MRRRGGLLLAATLAVVLVLPSAADAAPAQPPGLRAGLDLAEALWELLTVPASGTAGAVDGPVAAAIGELAAAVRPAGNQAAMSAAILAAREELLRQSGQVQAGWGALHVSRNRPFVDLAMADDLSWELNAKIMILGELLPRPGRAEVPEAEELGPRAMAVLDLVAERNMERARRIGPVSPQAPQAERLGQALQLWISNQTRYIDDDDKGALEHRARAGWWRDKYVEALEQLDEPGQLDEIETALRNTGQRLEAARKALGHAARWPDRDAEAGPLMAELILRKDLLERLRELRIAAPGRPLAKIVLDLTAFASAVQVDRITHQQQHGSDLRLHSSAPMMELSEELAALAQPRSSLLMTVEPQALMPRIMALIADVERLEAEGRRVDLQVKASIREARMSYRWASLLGSGDQPGPWDDDITLAKQQLTDQVEVLERLRDGLADGAGLRTVIDRLRAPDDRAIDVMLLRMRAPGGRPGRAIRDVFETEGPLDAAQAEMRRQVLLRFLEARKAEPGAFPAAGAERLPELRAVVDAMGPEWTSLGAAGMLSSLGAHAARDGGGTAAYRDASLLWVEANAAEAKGEIDDPGAWLRTQIADLLGDDPDGPHAAILARIAERMDGGESFLTAVAAIVGLDGDDDGPEGGPTPRGGPGGSGSGGSGGPGSGGGSNTPPRQPPPAERTPDQGGSPLVALPAQPPRADVSGIPESRAKPTSTPAPAPANPATPQPRSLEAGPRVLAAGPRVLAAGPRVVPPEVEVARPSVPLAGGVVARVVPTPPPPMPPAPSTGSAPPPPSTGSAPPMPPAPSPGSAPPAPPAWSAEPAEDSAAPVTEPAEQKVFGELPAARPAAPGWLPGPGGTVLTAP